MKKSTLILNCIILASIILLTECKPTPAKQTDSVIASDTTTLVADTIAQTVSVTKEVATEVDNVKKDSMPKLTPLTIIVSNLESPTAPVVVGVYGPKNKFLDEGDQLKEYHFMPKNGKLVGKITDLSYGVFGIAIYQDVNSDGKIDKNLIGIPKEPYAFSNNYKPTIKAPSFNDCKFVYDAKTNTVNMKLLK